MTLEPRNNLPLQRTSFAGREREVDEVKLLLATTQLQKVAKKRDDADVWYLVGEMENALVTGQMAVQGMIDLCADYTFVPDIATANALFIRKTIACESLLFAVEKALETVGGCGSSVAWVWSDSCATCTRRSSTPCNPSVNIASAAAPPSVWSGGLKTERGEQQWPSSGIPQLSRPADWR
jgi:hypothetical protein